MTGATLLHIRESASTRLRLGKAAGEMLGFSAPNRAYTFVTHLRCVAAHLVFGATVGAVSEASWAITGRLRPMSAMAVATR